MLVHFPGPANATVQGRLQTARHVTGVTATFPPEGSRALTASNSRRPRGALSSSGPLQVTQTNTVTSTAARGVIPVLGSRSAGAVLASTIRQPLPAGPLR